MEFCNHITVLNTSPQNESIAKQGKRFSFASFLTVDVLIYDLQLLVFFLIFKSVVSVAVLYSPCMDFFPPRLFLFVIGILCLQLINENMPIELSDNTFTVWCV